MISVEHVRKLSIQVTTSETFPCLQFQAAIPAFSIRTLISKYEFFLFMKAQNVSEVLIFNSNLTQKIIQLIPSCASCPWYKNVFKLSYHTF
jgi:hypothetical protein